MPASTVTGPALKNATAFWINVNLKWNNIMDQPFSITADARIFPWVIPTTGGWLLDGTPGDGSWTFFLDSIRTTYELKEAQDQN